MTLTALRPNRLTRAIDAVRDKFATLPADKLATVDATLALDFDDHFAYQTTQARAHASGLLATDEAQIIYMALGESGGSAYNGGWADGVDTATKYAVTHIIGMILEDRLPRP